MEIYDLNCISNRIRFDMVRVDNLVWLVWFGSGLG